MILPQIDALVWRINSNFRNTGHAGRILAVKMNPLPLIHSENLNRLALSRLSLVYKRLMKGTKFPKIKTIYLSTKINDW